MPVSGANGNTLTLGPLLPSDDGMQVYCNMRALGYADASLNPIWTNSTTATLTISPQSVFEPGYAWVDWWSNITSKAQVENGVAGAPDFSFATPKFESPTDGAPWSNYVNRVSAFFMPPTNGNYVFFVNADDTADLFLSTNSNPLDKHLVAQETAWSGTWGWLSGNGSTSQKRSDQWFAGRRLDSAVRVWHSSDRRPDVLVGRRS